MTFFDDLGLIQILMIHQIIYDLMMTMNLSFLDLEMIDEMIIDDLHFDDFEMVEIDDEIIDDFDDEIIIDDDFDDDNNDDSDEIDNDDNNDDFDEMIIHFDLICFDQIDDNEIMQQEEKHICDDLNEIENKFKLNHLQYDLCEV